MLGARLLQARLAQGMSLRDLADKVTVTAVMLSKYERDDSVPSSEVLLSIAEALGVRTEYFFRQTRIDLERVEHRNKHKWKLPKAAENKVLADVQDQLERWATLDDIIPAPWSLNFKIPAGLPKQVNNLDEVEAVAIKVREAWRLGLNPIPDLIDTMEAQGIKIFVTKFDDDRFEGMSALAGDHHLVVVSQNWTGDRQRFTLAHELGHLILEDLLQPDVDKEKACDRFAGAFLVPEPKVREALGQHRRALEVYELYLLKQEFGLSIQGWSFRARDLAVVSKSAFGRFWGYLNSKGWKTQEPGEPYPAEQPHLFEQTIYRALSEDLLGESKAAELLGLTVSSLAARRRMELVDAHTG